MKMTALLKVFDSWEGTAEKGYILHYIGRLGNFSFRLLLIKALFNDFPPHVNVNLWICSGWRWAKAYENRGVGRQAKRGLQNGNIHKDVEFFIGVSQLADCIFPRNPLCPRPCFCQLSVFCQITPRRGQTIRMMLDWWPTGLICHAKLSGHIEEYTIYVVIRYVDNQAKHINYKLIGGKLITGPIAFSTAN